MIMDPTVSCVNSVTTDNNASNKIIKLKRLKIEEGLLDKSILKYYKTHEEYCEVNLIEINQENKQFNMKLQSSFEDIKRLFHDIQATTEIQNNIVKDVDINEVKRDILLLEKKIRSFTMFIKSELTSLKVNEEKIRKDIVENTSEISKAKRQSKIKIKPFNDIVPSPVKSLIHSPLKYSEVQEFQEFMKNSKNLCGGWIPYNHNIFIQSWNKHIHMEYSRPDLNAIDFESFESYPLFIQDVIKKIPGITKEDIKSHCKWYLKYMHLKERQQRAIDKWKINKNIIKNICNSKSETTQRNCGKLRKDIIQSGSDESLRVSVSDKFREVGRLIATEIKSSHTIRTNSNSNSNRTQDENVSDKDDAESLKKMFNVNYNDSHEIKLRTTKRKIVVKKNGLGFIKPTLQWNNRCNDSSEDFIQTYPTDIEHIHKL